ncbi:hypothetical protein CPC08DRAFT_713510 [Agrocybe pediades]|nr:hypothetical protein CPC08DRAFT_713510 [Agrocybe pediades]
MTIILYDIPSNIAGVAWSPNTWKTRFCLNYKGLPYKTEWVEYPDIEAHCKKLGIKPTGKNFWTGGNDDLYTLPAIYDASTDTYIADSIPIAEYLDKTYPDTPPIFPPGTKALQLAFQGTFMPCLSPLWLLMGVSTLSKLNPPSADYFRKTREGSHPGITIEEMCPKGEKAKEHWEKLEKGLEKIAGWYDKAEGGPFIMGETVSWGDIVVGSILVWQKVLWGEESEQWKDWCAWHGGRWGKIFKGLESYMQVV